MEDNLGIVVSLSIEEWATFQGTRHDDNFEVARGGWLGDYPDPKQCSNHFISKSGNNDAQWRWEEYSGAPFDVNLNADNEVFDEAINGAMTARCATHDELLHQA